MGALGPAVHDDRGLILAAILAGGLLIGVLRHGIAGVAVVRVLPARILAVRIAFERGLLGAIGRLLIGLVEPPANLVADEAADHHAGRGRDQLARAMAD